MIEVRPEDFERFIPRLQEYSYKLTKKYKHRDLDIAKDAVQDTYLKFHKRISFSNKYLSYDYLFNELKLILWQKHLDYVNVNYKLSKHRFYEQHLPLSTEKVVSDNNYLNFIRYESLDDYYKFLSKTQIKYIEFIMKGNSHKQVAHKFGVTVKAVEGSIRKAVKRFEKINNDNN